MYSDIIHFQLECVLFLNFSRLIRAWGEKESSYMYRRSILKVSVCSLNLGEEFKILKEKITTIYVMSVLTSFLDKF